MEVYETSHYHVTGLRASLSIQLHIATDRQAVSTGDGVYMTLDGDCDVISIIHICANWFPLTESRCRLVGNTLLRNICHRHIALLTSSWSATYVRWQRGTARRRTMLAPQQLIDISYAPGPRQQTRRTLLQRANGTDRRTDTLFIFIYLIQQTKDPKVTNMSLTCYTTISVVNTKRTSKIHQ